MYNTWPIVYLGMSMEVEQISCGFFAFSFFLQSLGVLLAIVHFGRGGAGVLSQSLLALLSDSVPLPP